MKTCSSCKVEKPLTEFGKDKRKKDGLDYRCKSCLSEKMRLYYLKKTEIIKVKKSEYRQKNAEIIKVQMSEYIRKYPDKYRLSVKKSGEKYREKNRLKRIESAKDYYARNRESWVETNRMHTLLLTDHYIRHQLRMGKEEAPKELIEAKRIHMQIKRKLKELKA